MYDQGSTWTFRFSSQGRVVGDLVSTRADLERGGWRVVIPDTFAESLRADGVVPTA